MKKLFDRLLLGLHWFLALTPLTVLGCLGVAGNASLALPLLPAILLMCLCPLVKYRKTCSISLGMLTLVLYAALIPPAGFTEICFLIVLAALLFVLLPRFIRPRGESLTGFAMVLFCGLHLVAMIVMRSEMFAPAKDVMGLFFAAFLLMTVFSLNTSSLCIAMGEEKRPSVQLIAGNRVVLGLLCLPVIIGSCWQSLAKGANWLWSKIIWLLGLILSIFQREETAESVASGEGGGMDLSGLGGAAEASPFWRTLEEIVKYLGYAALVAAACYGLYRLARKLPGWIRILAEKLKKYMSSLDLEYEDKKESLFRWDTLREDVRSSLKQHLPHPKRRINWSRLNPREQVRTAYSVLRDEFRETGPGATAQEVLHRHLEKDEAEKASEIYNRARYSTHEVTPADAQKMRAL